MSLLSSSLFTFLQSATIILTLLLLGAYSACAGIQNDAIINSNVFGTSAIYNLSSPNLPLLGTATGLGNLYGAAASPDGRYFYATSYSTGNLYIIDSQTFQVLRTVNTGGGAIEPASSPDGQTVYVTNYTAGTFSAVNPNTGAIIATITGFTNPWGIAISPDGTTAYVGSNANGGVVQVINLATHTIVASITTGGGGDSSFQVALSPDGKTLYASDYLGRVIRVINTQTRSLVASIPITNNPDGLVVSPDGTKLFVGGANGTIFTINTATDAVTSTISPGNGSGFTGMGITPNGQTLLAVGWGTGNGNSFGAYNLTTNSLIGAVAVSQYPESYGDPVGPNLIVSTGGPVKVSSDSDFTNLGFGQFVDFAGGTLQLTGNLTTNRTISILGTTATIDPNGFNAVFNGPVINGVSNLTGAIIIGVFKSTLGGSVTLTGNNTFTGGVLLFSGALRVSSDANLGDPSGFLSFDGGTIEATSSFTTARSQFIRQFSGRNATYLIDSGVTLTDNGVITGAGLTKDGPGTLVLNATNFYGGGFGGTLIKEGTLSVSSDGNLGFNSAAFPGGITFAGGTLEITGPNYNSTNRPITLQSNTGTFFIADPNNVFTTLQALTGGGSLAKDGPGTLILGAPSTYTGGTTTVLNGTLRAGVAGAFVNNSAYVVNGGTLDLNSFSLTASDLNGSGGTVNLGSATAALIGLAQAIPSFATLTVRTSNIDNFVGNIVGSGSLVKDGSGSLTLSGNNTYSGGTTLLNGQLIVGSPAALGTGNVTVNGGVLTSDLQNIVVGHNYTQTGGTLELTIGGTTPGSSNLLQVAGTATLGGQLSLMQGNNFVPKVGQTFTLVNTGSGLTGTFAPFSNPFKDFTVVAFYTPKTLYLDVVYENFQQQGKTPDEESVGGALDKLEGQEQSGGNGQGGSKGNPFPETGSGENNAITEFGSQNQPPPTANDPLLTFLEQIASFSSIPGFENFLSPEELASFYEVSFSNSNVQQANLEERLAEARAGSNGFSSSLTLNNNHPGVSFYDKDGPANSPFVPSATNKWGVFVTGSGDFVDVSGGLNDEGYNFVTSGVTIGFDYRLTPNVIIGVAGGYAHAAANLSQNGSLTVNSGRGGVYGTVFSGGLYFNGYIGGGYNSYDAHRSALLGFADGSTSGGEFDSFGGVGYDFHWHGLTLGPTGSLQYTDVSLESYNESGSLAPLAIHSQSQHSLRTDLGGHIDYTFALGTTKVTPEFSASWQHEYKYSRLPITASFAGFSGTTFTVVGPAIGQDSALIHAGLRFEFNDRFGGFVAYDGDLGRDHYSANGVNGGLSFAF